MAVVYHEDFLKQTQSYGHPECPDRLSSIISYLDAVGIDTVRPEPAELTDIQPIHTIEYLEFLRDFGQGQMDADTFIWPHTYEMAMLAAGGAIAAADLTSTHKEPAYALLRPPGHHATAQHGGGFCYINNIAVAAEHLLKKLDKVAIIDIDVHHGNGTNDIFLDRDDVLYISTHQWGIYPGTGPAEQVGNGTGEGYTVNIPLGSMSGDATFQLATESLIMPILRKYRPDAMLVSLGVDAHYLDPLASLTLSSKGFMDVIAMLEVAASEMANGRLAFYLEGGYNLNALAEVMGGSIARSHGQEIELLDTEVLDSETTGLEWVERALEIQGQFWDLRK